MIEIIKNELQILTTDNFHHTNVPLTEDFELVGELQYDPLQLRKQTNEIREREIEETR